MMAGAKVRGALRAVVFLMLAILFAVPTGAMAASVETITTAAPTTAALGGYDLPAKLFATAHTSQPAGRLAAPMPSLDPGGSRLVTSSAVAAEGGAADIGATTAHGAERVAGAGATRGGVLSGDQILQVRAGGQVWSQAGGGTVRVLQNSAGRFDVVVDGNRGLITTFSNLSQKSLDRLAGNYGWTP